MRRFIEIWLLAIVFFSGAVVSVSAQSPFDGFDPNADDAVRVVVVQGDGKILIGGDFTMVAGATRNYIARLNPDGTLDAAFNPDANGPVNTIAVQPDGKILIGGQFLTIGGQTRNGIARLNSATGAADSFAPNPNSDVYSLALQSDGKILLGGNFTAVGVASRSFIARLSHDTAALQSLSVLQKLIVWTRGGAAGQFNYATYELSTNGGITWTFLGSASPSLAGLQTDNKSNELAPQASSYTLGGLNLPTTQNILIRARGYYQNGSETTEELVQNTYLLAPTAASVSVGGRVLTADGRGISRTQVSITDTAGNVRSAITNPFGYYHFDEIPFGETYVLSVRHKRYQFSPRVFFVTEEITDFNLTAEK